MYVDVRMHATILQCRLLFTRDRDRSDLISDLLAKGSTTISVVICMMAATNPSLYEASPALEKILSLHKLKPVDLHRECPQSVRRAVAVRLADYVIFWDWEMVGRSLDFSWEEVRVIDRENTSPQLCGVALLDAWNKRDGSSATYLKLADVLCRRKHYNLVDLLCIKLKLTSSDLAVSLSESVTQSRTDSEVPHGNGEQIISKLAKLKLI